MPPIYVSNLAMTDPGDAPFVPNLQRGLFMNFNARLDAPNNDQVVSKITTRGSAPTLDRTFDKKRGTTFTFPVSVGGADPFLQFAGTQSLANSNMEGSVSNPYVLLSNELSIAMRVRIHDWTGPSTAGFLRGVVSRTAALRPGSAGEEGTFIIAGGNSATNVTVSTNVKTNEWSVIVIAYSATTPNLLLAGSSNIGEFTMAPGTSLQGFGFATNITNAAVLGSKFDLSHFAVWDRSIFSDEILNLRNIWESGGDLQL